MTTGGSETKKKRVYGFDEDQPAFDVSVGMTMPLVSYLR